MGMNIYTMDGKHIGKRSADGIWCWDCKKRVIKGVCSFCGKSKIDTELLYNPALRELGFDRSKSKNHVGIDGASSFCWCTGEYGLGNTVEEIKDNLKRRRKVKTEYGDIWTIKKFWNMFKDVIREDTESGNFS